MRATGRQVYLVCTTIAITLIAVSCSLAPEGPRPGTPAFQWNAAKQAFSAGDYAKAADNLERVAKSDNEFTARALPWHLVLLSGMAQGYIDLAETFDKGARANRANPTPFLKLVNQYRNHAEDLAIQFFETLQKFSGASKKQKVILAFPYPTGSAAEITALKRISSGILLPDAEVETVGKRVVEKQVLLAACRAVGAPEDAAKTQQILKSDTVQVEWEVFALAIAQELYDQSQLFARDKLDRPDRLQMFCGKALESLQDVPDSKEVKTLKAAIQKSLKRVKG